MDQSVDVQNHSVSILFGWFLKQKTTVTLTWQLLNILHVYVINLLKNK